MIIYNWFSRLALQSARLIVFASLILLCLLTRRISNLKKIIRNRKKSHGQFYQDLMVISQRDTSYEPFYFVEFGATNGVDLSNTLLFEKEFGARGIVVEPAKIYHEALFKNRTCEISTKCVYSLSDLELEFFETSNPDLSGLHINKHFYSLKQVQQAYNVKTISLLDLLSSHNAPKEIDLLSIDTEGSEFEILNAFNFSEYKFKIIICEHNFSRDRKRIKKLLEKNGYVRKFSWISFVDDWYFLLPKF